MTQKGMSSTQKPKELHFPIRRSKLAAIYKVDKEVIIEWFKGIGVDHSRTLSPADIVRFIETYGWPTKDIIPSIPGVNIKLDQLSLFDTAA